MSLRGLMLCFPGFSRRRREEIEQHNDEVMQNRGMLRTLSEAALHLSKQELPFRGHDSSSAW